MSISVDGSTIHLQGHCPVEEAEALLQALQDDPRRSVDLTQVIAMHMAIAQILVAIRPRLVMDGKNGFVRDVLVPALRAGQGELIDTGTNGGGL
jgi:hypothetical protein